MGDGVVLVSSANETAFAARDLLETRGIEAPTDVVGTRRFFSSGDVEWFASLGRRLLGPELGEVSPWMSGASS